MLRISAPAPPDGPALTVAVDGSSFAAPDGAAVKLPEGWAITAGLLDLQVNGLDDLFPLADPASLPALDLELAARGVAGYLVAVPSADPEQVRALASAAEAFAAEPGSGLLGLHLEGPVLAPEFRGAHREEHLRTGDDPEALALLDLPGVRLVTVAPEVPGALAYARAAQDRGIVVAAGHTGATAEQAREAIDAGIRLVTHVFNAMTPMHQRAPGAALAYLQHPQARVAFIADGAHLHDDLVELILATAPDRCLLVSDVAPNEGVDPDHDGLAGSAATIADGVRRVATVHGLGLTAAVGLASERPAEVLGDPGRGRVEPGARADMTIWAPGAEVAATFRGGRLVHRSDAFSL
jgi:N-acetylglucosamine-6-phosphate deacetylase